MKLKLFKDNLEYEFLPPALEIEKTPPSPLGRAVIWITFSLVILIGLWSYFGKVDEVATARGKIIPDGRVKTLQPLEEGIIKAVHVKEGERVKEGQLLIEFDPTINEADFKSKERTLLISKVEKELLLAKLYGKDIEQVLSQMNNEMSGDVAEAIIIQRDLEKAKNAEQEAKETALVSSIAQKSNRLNTAQNLLDLLKEDVEMVEVDEKANLELYEQGGISKMDYLSKKRELNLAIQKVEEQQAVVFEINEGLNNDINNLNTLKTEKQLQLMSELSELNKAITTIEGEVVIARKRFELQKLGSPVNGTVHGINAYTIGGIVTSAQPLITVVPEGTPLVVEADVLNKDIGFIKVGQIAAIKMDTFPFQKYGTIEGEVLSVSPDAVEDQKTDPFTK